MTVRAFFLSAPHGGQRLCIHHPAQGVEKRGQVLYLHPFAEEMNKSRRMAALTARSLAAAGYEVLQLDLLGCGDSSGDFEDANWEAWVEDAILGCHWLQQQATPAPLWLWGLRAGCLLAVEVARRLMSPANCLLVQPPASGRPQLQQFLRLKVAGEMLDGASKGVMAEMREALAQGQAVEVAGYRVSAALARGIEEASLQPPSTSPGHLVWLELNSQTGSTWTPVSAQMQARWRDAGWSLAAELVQGPAFWQTSEIEEAPLLIQAALRHLQTARAPVRPECDASGAAQPPAVPDSKANA